MRRAVILWLAAANAAETFGPKTPLADRDAFVSLALTAAAANGTLSLPSLAYRRNGAAVPHALLYHPDIWRQAADRGRVPPIVLRPATMVISKGEVPAKFGRGYEASRTAIAVLRALRPSPALAAVAHLAAPSRPYACVMARIDSHLRYRMEKVPLAAVFAALRAKWPAPRVKALVVATPRDLERNDQWPDGPWPGVAKTVEAGAAAVREYGPSTDPSFLKNVDVAAVVGERLDEELCGAADIFVGAGFSSSAVGVAHARWVLMRNDTYVYRRKGRTRDAELFEYVPPPPGYLDPKQRYPRARPRPRDVSTANRASRGRPARGRVGDVVL